MKHNEHETKPSNVKQVEAVAASESGDTHYLLVGALTRPELIQLVQRRFDLLQGYQAKFPSLPHPTHSGQAVL
ncbi:hypothetical protein VNO77_25593 [Canavalia gladiata]|uniref:Uncharacterized protein n=1 Tax=Canavalia gladiata TaxID=3824 RepID=A0AAN9QB23_CANGL